MALLLPARFDASSLISRGTAIRAIRSPQGVVEDLPSSLSRPPPRRGPAVRAFTALERVQYHRNATLRGHEENRRDPPGGERTFTRFEASRRRGSTPISPPLSHWKQAY